MRERLALLFAAGVARACSTAGRQVSATSLRKRRPVKAAIAALCALGLGRAWAAEGQTTAAVQFKSPGAWRTAAPELYTELKPH